MLCTCCLIYLLIWAENGTCYLFNNGMLQEIQWFKQSYGSWFLGDYISQGKSHCWLLSVDECLPPRGCKPAMFMSHDCSHVTDGSLYMATPVDPVFILLPVFDQARMKVTHSICSLALLNFTITFLSDFNCHSVERWWSWKVQATGWDFICGRISWISTSVVTCREVYGDRLSNSRLIVLLWFWKSWLHLHTLLGDL